MKLSMIKSKGRSVPAALLSSGNFVDLAAASDAGLLGSAPVRLVEDILDLDGPLADPARRLVDRLEIGEAGLLDQLNAAGALQDAATAEYDQILRPRLIMCSGMAFKEHNKEMDVNMPAEPIGFLKSPTAITAHNKPILLPPKDPGMVDFECEFSLVIGRPMYKVSEDEALSYLGGVTMVNDVGSRVVVPEFVGAMRGDDPMACLRYNNINIHEKQHPTFCPMGPVVETIDSYGDPNDFTVETRLNGEVMQSAHSDDLVFPLARTLSFFSQWYRFLPGDVVTTGSPSGVGFARNPPRLLKVGDVVEVSGSKIGTLRNTVAASD